MEDITLGTTDRTILVFIPDPASTTGAGKTGLAHSAITVSYTRVETDNDVTNTDVTSSLNALTTLTDTHNDWGWKEVSATLAPGLYRLDIADAVFASGAWYAVVQVCITSGLSAATPKAFRLVANTFNTSTESTALFNGVADAVLSRNVSNVEATISEHCLGSVVLATLEWSTTASPGNWLIYRTNGTTVHLTKPLGTNPAAENVTDVS